MVSSRPASLPSCPLPELRHPGVYEQPSSPARTPAPHRTADMSAGELPSLEECLETHLPEAELSHVRRILFGKETA